jgi:hypothetical protein
MEQKSVHLIPAETIGFLRPDPCRETVRYRNTLA